jgi:SPP1 family predicted phage head-tail adaptor
MRAGKLRTRVTVQQRTATLDTFGQQSVAWSALLSNVPVELNALTGRELLAAQAVNAEVTHEVMMRYHSELANPVAVAGMRLQYGTRLFDLRACLIDEKVPRGIRLLVSEGLTEG